MNLHNLGQGSSILPQSNCLIMMHAPPIVKGSQCCVTGTIPNTKPQRPQIELGASMKHSLRSMMRATGSPNVNMSCSFRAKKWRYVLFSPTLGLSFAIKRIHIRKIVICSGLPRTLDFWWIWTMQVSQGRWAWRMHSSVSSLQFFPTFERDPFATFLVTSFVRWAAVHVSALLMLLVSGLVKGLKRLF